MNTFKLVFAIFIGFVFSCKNKQEFNSIDKSNEKESFVPLQRIVIADLPDSLQPKAFFLVDMPKPKVGYFHESKILRIYLGYLIS